MRCLVPASRTIISGDRRGDLDLFFPIASTVNFNAVLVDEKNLVQVGSLISDLKNHKQWGSEIGTSLDESWSERQNKSAKNIETIAQRAGTGH